MKKMIVLFFLFAFPQLVLSDPKEIISLKADFLIEQGVVLPVGCVITTAYKGDLGDLLGNELIEIELKDANNSSTYGVFERNIVSPVGKVKFKIEVSRDQNISNQLALSLAIFQNSKRIANSALFFNKRNELTFPFTQTIGFLGRKNSKCYRANLGITPKSLN